MRIVQESGVAGVQELQNEEVFSSASNLNFTSAPARSSWLLGFSATARLSRARVALESSRAPARGLLLAPGSWLLAPGSWLLAPGSWLLAPARKNGCPSTSDVFIRSHHAGALPILSGASGIEEGLVT
jgi:hypothetical protein